MTPDLWDPRGRKYEDGPYEEVDHFQGLPERSLVLYYLGLSPSVPIPYASYVQLQKRASCLSQGLVGYSYSVSGDMRPRIGTRNNVE